MSDNTTNGAARLDALRKREQALRLTITAELDRERKRQARQRERLVAIMGNALLDEADRSPNFKIMLKQTLSTAVADGKARQFLSQMGWL